MRCFAAILTIMAGHAALTIFTAVHFCIHILAAVFTIVTRFTAFTILTAILFCVVIGSSGTIILTTAMQLIISLSGGFYITGIITCSSNSLLYFSSIGS